jgi:hypothetical protein
MTELTRRQLAGLAVGSIGITLAAQTTDWLAQAVESKRKAAADLAAVDVPMSVEPAFEFKA